MVKEWGYDELGFGENVRLLNNKYANVKWGIQASGGENKVNG